MIPPRIAKLPVDGRGYPIPWNVLIGKDRMPIFTANDSIKHSIAFRNNLCPICGEGLDPIRWFIGGPLSAFDPHGWYMDLPVHQECAEYALQVCPYLACRKYVHRVDIIDPENLPEGLLLIDHTQIPGRPKVFVAVASRITEVRFNPPPMLVHVRPGRPYLEIQYWNGVRLPGEEGTAIVRSVLGERWSPDAFLERSLA